MKHFRVLVDSIEESSALYAQIKSRDDLKTSRYEIRGNQLWLHCECLNGVMPLLEMMAMGRQIEMEPSETLLLA